MLNGKTALVTGSTSGIGQAIAEAIAAQGANIVLNGFGDATEIEALRARIAEQSGVTVTYSPADMSRPDEIQALVSDAVAQFGAVDVLVNNAGIQHVAPVDDFPDDRWEMIISINLSSSFYTTKAALPGMRERGWGRVVWLGTIGAVRPGPRMPNYYASKAALPNVCVSLAQELAGTGITVNLVSPGLIATEEVLAHLERRGESTDGVAAIDDVASAVAFLVSDRGAAINAANLRVDCGRSRLAIG